MVDVAQDLRLGAVALRPFHSCRSSSEKGVGILQVPEPGPADSRSRLVGADPQAHAAQAMDGVKPGKPPADDGDIELTGGRTIRGVRQGGYSVSIE